MTIADNYSPIKQSGNGVTVNFSFDFSLLDESYIRVYQEIDGKQTLVAPEKYDVAYQSSGGSVTFKEAPAAGTYIVIARQVPLSQETPYKTSSGFPANRVEENLDKLTAITQQLSDDVERTPKLPVGTSDVDLNLPAPSAGKALVWNQDATGLTNSTINIDGTIGEVTDLKNQAEAARDAAAASEKAAAISESAAAKSAADVKEWADNSEIWAEGTDEQVAALGGEKSSKGWAEDAKETAKYMSIGNIGDIKESSREGAAPVGGEWCDGTEYDFSLYPKVGEMLAGGELKSKTYADWQTELDTYGETEYFAYDAGTQKFKVPNMPYNGTDGKVTDSRLDIYERPSRKYVVLYSGYQEISLKDYTDQIDAHVASVESDIQEAGDTQVKAVNDAGAEFEANAATKTNDFNDNATAKTEAFNTNAAEKQAAIDQAGQQAADNAALAQSWAVGTQEERPEGSAKHWAEQAQKALLPSQEGQAGKFLTTDGSEPSWTEVEVDISGAINAHDTSLNAHDNKFQVVNELPAAPENGVFYFIPE